jgi:hypothetical protein
MSLLQKLNSLCAMAHNIRATSIIIFIFVIFYFCQGSSAGGATKAVGQLTAPLCPGGAPDNSLAFQRRVSEPKERSVPKGRLRATSIFSRPFGTRVSALASPALKRRMSLRDKTPAAHAPRFQSHPSPGAWPRYGDPGR